MEILKKTLKELDKMFPYISHDSLKYEKAHPSRKTERGIINYLSRKNARNMLLAMRQDIVELVIKINWKKSRTWGMNPHASYYCVMANGNCDSGDGFTCSGCGYDKASTVISYIFNEIMVGMAYRKLKRKRKSFPYGLFVPSRGGIPHYDYGVGVDCYERIVRWLGGTMEHVACSDTFDQYKITFKKK